MTGIFSVKNEAPEKKICQTTFCLGPGARLTKKWSAGAPSPKRVPIPEIPSRTAQRPGDSQGSPRERSRVPGPQIKAVPNTTKTVMTVAGCCGGHLNAT